MSAITCAVVNHKGGVGKTTLAMNLAAGLTRRGSCIVLDADPQCSASRWARLAADARPFPAPVLPAADGAAKQLVDCAGRYAYIVVDCPPAMHSQDVQQVLARADVALIPVLPSPMDLWASVGMVEIVVSAQQSNTTLRAYLVLNQLEPRNALSRSMESALAEFAVPAARTGMRRRAVYRRAALEGSSVYELASLGSAAAQEIDAIIEEVIET